MTAFALALFILLLVVSGAGGLVDPTRFRGPRASRPVPPLQTLAEPPARRMPMRSAVIRPLHLVEAGFRRRQAP